MLFVTSSIRKGRLHEFEHAPFAALSKVVYIIFRSDDLDDMDGPAGMYERIR